jgi:hypothetical protein
MKYAQKLKQIANIAETFYKRLMNKFPGTHFKPSKTTKQPPEKDNDHTPKSGSSS